MNRLAASLLATIAAVLWTGTVSCGAPSSGAPDLRLREDGLHLGRRVLRHEPTPDELGAFLGRPGREHDGTLRWDDLGIWAYRSLKTQRISHLTIHCATANAKPGIGAGFRGRLHVAGAVLACGRTADEPTAAAFERVPHHDWVRVVRGGIDVAADPGPDGLEWISIGFPEEGSRAPGPEGGL